MGATIYNSDLTKELTDGAKIQTAFDKVPNQIAEKVVPTMEVNPKLLYTIDHLPVGSASDAITATIHTAATDKDTYLHYINLTVAKDAVSDSLFTEVRCQPKGKAVSILLRIRYEPTTAGQFTSNLVLPKPILLERGTNITLNNNTATASIDATAIIGITEVENINA